MSLIAIEPVARTLFRWLLPLLCWTDAGPLPPPIPAIYGGFSQRAPDYGLDFKNST